MPAILKYGSFQFRAGEPAIQTTVQPVMNDALEPVAHIHRYQISGLLVTTGTGGNAATALNTRIDQMKTAFTIQGQNLVLTLPDGSRQSTFRLLNSQAIGGVRVVEGPNFDTTQPAALVTFCPFTVTLEAEIPVFGSSLMLLSFEESINFEEGPITGHIELLNGPAVKQGTRTHRLYRATQQGSAVGYRGPPNPAILAPKIWPSAYVSGGSAPRSPKRRGNNYCEFPVTWQYNFEANVPLAGTPNFWK